MSESAVYAAITSSGLELEKTGWRIREIVILFGLEYSEVYMVRELH
jgi:hypothetical protein